jgi:hypothetical protein
VTALLGFRKLRLDEFRRNRQMGPLVQTWLGSPPRGALPLPETPADWADWDVDFNDWENFPYDKPVQIKGLPPGLTLFGGMGTRVILGLLDPRV